MAVTAHIRAGAGRDRPVAVAVWDRTDAGERGLKVGSLNGLTRGVCSACEPVRLPGRGVNQRA